MILSMAKMAQDFQEVDTPVSEDDSLFSQVSMSVLSGKFLDGNSFSKFASIISLQLRCESVILILS